MFPVKRPHPCVRLARIPVHGLHLHLPTVTVAIFCLPASRPKCIEHRKSHYCLYCSCLSKQNFTPSSPPPVPPLTHCSYTTRPLPSSSTIIHLEHGVAQILVSWKLANISSLFHLPFSCCIFFDVHQKSLNDTC